MDTPPSPAARDQARELLVAWLQGVLADNPAQVEQYRAGKTKVLGYLVGQVMKLSKGKANPQQVNELLRKRLDS